SIFVLGSWLNSQGRATVGEIVTFMGFATMLIGRLENAMGFISNMFFQMHKLKEFFDVLDTEAAVRNKPDALPLANVRGHVAFDQLTPSYGDARQAVIDMSFEAQAGMTVALVGPAGSGKSSSMALLSRLWDPTAGRILI